NKCGAVHNVWAGKCSDCDEWNTLEQVIDVGGTKSEQAVRSGNAVKTSNISSISRANKKSKRFSVGINDIDEILGGGFVPGGVVLFAGQPGIGKSTLLLQIANNLSEANKTLYISGEESIEQVSMRGERLGANGKNLAIASSGSANDISATIASGDYDVVVVDSIQTVSTEEVNGIPGAVSQVTNSAQLITVAAKQSGTAVILVGHVTKEGSIAGPKILEHLVDVVLQFEGDRYGGFKIVRALKNRFGTTNEGALFEMKEQGLVVVENPSAALLAERQIADGSVVFATIEGNRPLLVEIQALVQTTSYGYPKRTASGFDLNRLNVLIAVLERRTKLKLSDKDIYVNVVGGMRLDDPAADLAVCMAIASAATERKLGDGAVVFGEVGLGGEVRRVMAVDKRIAEAKKLGFTYAISPVGDNQKFTKGVRDMRQALIDHLKS
ncbi:DNA repair protein RadA, partial [Candidatus Saccharibacteria bacterium]|nr:DNA repair protein RadA [Candidatus Saccharibacteria bacterium]